MEPHNFSKIVPAMVAVALGLTANIQGAEAANVALGQPVVVTAGSVNGAPLSSLTDGNFLPRGTQWQTGTVWWNGKGTQLEVDLGGSFTLDGAIVQADDNDAYLLEVFDLAVDSWVSWWNVPNYDAFGWGIQTRPDVTDNTVWQALPPVLTNRLRFSATGEYGRYAVSEIQVRGSEAAPIPTPALLPGLMGMGAAALRKRKQEAEA